MSCLVAELAHWFQCIIPGDVHLGTMKQTDHSRLIIAAEQATVHRQM